MAIPPIRLPQAQELHGIIMSILSAKTLTSYSRALMFVEEVMAHIISSGDPSPLAAELLQHCHAYQSLCCRSIEHLVAVELAYEKNMYRCAKNGRSGYVVSEGERKRRGRVFDVDQGEHIVGALEALTLEEYLSRPGQVEDGRQESRRVRWVI
ncbi:hypothetical protein GGS20DRAFT_431834 [Poronia punctata]|nr:hypothetical protein GGS20DRAFT_431834 [Poronia punctata]